MRYLLIALSSILLVTVMIVYNAFAWGVVTYNFWDWFVMPVFNTLPALSLAGAVGLNLFIGLFKASSSGIKDKYLDRGNILIIFLVSPWLTLTVGFIINAIIN